MEPPPARIPARSRRQAMDWSLVLVSQGIETTIDYSENGDGWGLLVAFPDYEKALKSIELYRLENRGWPWQQQVFRPGMLFDWGSLAWVALIALFGAIQSHEDLTQFGVMSASEIENGHWWRLFTAVWLHADLGHLASNAVFGMLLLGLAMGLYGTGTGLLASYLAGVGAPRPSLGASGMVMGSLGLLAVHSFRHRRQSPLPWKYLVPGFFAGVLLFLLWGLAPGTNVIAHFGGFLSGILLGWLFPLHLRENSKANVLSGFLFALLVIIPWWLALSRH